MKKTVNILLQFVLGTCLTGAAVAQTTPPAKDSGEMRLKVTERNGGELREIERTYRTEGMTDEKRDALVNKLIDSLRATRKSKDSQISVTIEDERGTEEVRFKKGTSQEAIGRVFRKPRAPRISVIPPRSPMPPNVRRGRGNIEIEDGLVFADDSLGKQRLRQYRRQMDTLRVAMQKLQREIGPMTERLQREIAPMAERLQRDLAPMAERLKRDLAPMADRLNRFQWQQDWSNQMARPFDSWSEGTGQTSTIRGLNAYPSNPDKFMLNVRFTTPGKGDALIVVTNPKGKEVARRELKDFTGEFVGQVDLGRRAEGVYFVTVTQNEDGAVRRVMLKKDEAGTK